jgi:mono/diheme cytochrome c family protein
MKTKLLSLILVGGVFFIAACSETADTTSGNELESSALTNTPVRQRWYTEQQLVQGSEIYQTHCASCHKSDASGTSNWRQKDANDNYPAPPLNGSAHTWHHHLKGLKNTVRFGGVQLGGTMPGFKNKLNNQQIEAVLAWVQSHWSDEIYSAWQTRNTQALK